MQLVCVFIDGSRWDHGHSSMFRLLHPSPLSHARPQRLASLAGVAASLFFFSFRRLPQQFSKIT